MNITNVDINNKSLTEESMEAEGLHTGQTGASEMADDCINTENHLKGIVDLHIHSPPSIRNIPFEQDIFPFPGNAGIP